MTAEERGNSVPFWGGESERSERKKDKLEVEKGERGLVSEKTLIRTIQRQGGFKRESGKGTKSQKEKRKREMQVGGSEKGETLPLCTGGVIQFREKKRENKESGKRKKINNVSRKLADRKGQTTSPWREVTERKGELPSPGKMTIKPSGRGEGQHTVKERASLLSQRGQQ